MASVEFSHAPAGLFSGLFSALRAGLARIGFSFARGMTAYTVARSRMGEIERLEAKSDAELAEMGLMRDDIYRHVFRDILYI